MRVVQLLVGKALSYGQLARAHCPDHPCQPKSIAEDPLLSVYLFNMVDDVGNQRETGVEGWIEGNGT